VITELYWLIVISIIAACFSDFGKTIFQQELAFFKFSIIEFSRTVCFGVSLVGIMYYLRYNLKAWHPIFLQAVSMFIVFFVALRRRFRVSGLFKVKDSLFLGSSILKGDYRYLFGYFVLVALFVQVDVFMLKAIGVEIDLATYGAAFRYYALVSLGLGAVHVVLLPLIQKVRSRGELEGIFARHLRMVLVFGVAVLFCAWVSKWIIPWVDKGKYPDAVLVFRILAISAIISFAFSPHANLIFRFEDFKFLFTLICISLALSVGLNYFFIPILGAIGSAIASLIAYCCINGTIYVRARKFRVSFN
jgi:O-antigen/teichoic acid export membrane protein